jgi:hypothetical protein
MALSLSCVAQRESRRVAIRSWYCILHIARSCMVGTPKSQVEIQPHNVPQLSDVTKIKAQETIRVAKLIKLQFIIMKPLWNFFWSLRLTSRQGSSLHLRLLPILKTTLFQINHYAIPFSLIVSSLSELILNLSLCLLCCLSFFSCQLPSSYFFLSP